ASPRSPVCHSRSSRTAARPCSRTGWRSDCCSTSAPPAAATPIASDPPAAHNSDGRRILVTVRRRLGWYAMNSPSVASVFPLLEPLLPRVQKPIQYVGGELNSTVKDWDAATVRWALMYPDAYEVGLPNQGVMILYELINERPDALAERTYSVWP